MVAEEEEDVVSILCVNRMCLKCFLLVFACSCDIFLLLNKKVVEEVGVVAEEEEDEVEEEVEAHQVVEAVEGGIRYKLLTII